MTDQPQKFKMNQNRSESLKGHTFDVRRLLSLSLALVVTVGILTFFAFQIKWFYDNFEEVKFALKKPNIVKMVREDYEKKQKELEQSYTRKDKTSEQKLIEEVVKKLQKTNDF